MKTSEILDILIGKIKRDYSNDISIVYVYGSYLRNDFHSLSDIDLFIVKKTKKGQNLGLTFILNGIGYDFWAVSWEWVESVANYDTRSPSLITEGKVIYYSSEDDLTRFCELQEKALVIDKEKYKKKSVEKMNDVYKTVFSINNSNNISYMRHEIIGFFYDISEVLSLINHKMIKQQRKHFKHEIMEMENIPKNFERNWEILFNSNNIPEIKMVINNMTLEIVELVNRYTKTNELISFNNVFDGWYEEMIQHYNKIYHACNINDYQNALFASVELSHALESNFIRIDNFPKLPNMVEAYDPKDLMKLKIVAQEHQNQFEQLLIKNGVNILKFNDIEEFKEYYNKV